LKGSLLNETIDNLPGDVALIPLDGRLDFLSAEDARRRFDQAISAGTSRLVVDLSQVSFVDSSGLGALIGGLKLARGAGGDLWLVALTDQAQSLLKLTSLDKVFQTLPTLADAVTALQRQAH
jgi:anti-sigma B factor antagonist